MEAYAKAHGKTPADINEGDVFAEKARHPRFHVGKSLLPAKLSLLDKLAGAANVCAIGMEIRPHLLAFKGLYSGMPRLNFRRTLTAWKMRKKNIRSVELADGMTN